MDLTELACALGSGCLASLAPTVFRRQGSEPERQMGLQVSGNLLALLTAGGALLWLRPPLGS
jgi:hypothetical protein